MRNKLLALLFLTGLLACPVKAQPLETLTALGDFSLSLFEKWQREEIKAALKKEDLATALAICKKLPDRLTFALRERLGTPRVWVRLLAQNYIDVGNTPPPAVAESLTAMEAEKEMEGVASSRIVILEGGKQTLYAYVVPLIDRESCLSCHSKGGLYVPRIKQFYPEFRPARERIGDLRGVLVIYFSPEVLGKN